MFRVTLEDSNSVVIVKNVSAIGTDPEPETPVGNPMDITIDASGKATLSGDTTGAKKVYVYYIGSEQYTGATGNVGWWSSSADAVLRNLALLETNKDYNGPSGYYYFAADAERTLTKEGNYVFRVTLEDSNSVVIVKNVSGPDEGETPNGNPFGVSIDANGKITMNNTDGIVKTYVYYIGSEEYTGVVGETDWWSSNDKALCAQALSEANKAYNGPSGYYHFAPGAERSVEAAGNYVLRVVLNTGKSVVIVLPFNGVPV